ncbi:uncharacterized protein LOC120358516 [Solenopsis invicta]|uniref:uncharacterized protein LOC120358516 n=1 Tax=Solenopsis invicta TaxID=13686 RepID=UPI00193CBA78|nr:uncharacterized protein LOC120358516 [Solenopsis invicta]
MEKEWKGKKDLYSKEKEKYYNRNDWGVSTVEAWERKGGEMELKIIERERDIQKQEEESRILESRYNKKYREIRVKSGESRPRYLEIESLNKIRGGEGIRTLINLKCKNMEEANKYWLREKERECVKVGIIWNIRELSRTEKGLGGIKQRKRRDYGKNLRR